MSTPRWNQIETLFWAALDRDAAERAAFLDEACAGDAALRREVEGMLAAHETSHGLQIEQHLLGDDPPRPADDEAMIGTRVGPYRLVQMLGRGGMGTVYLAERADGAFEQQVALKLIRSGWHSAEIVQRFRLERQILARLDHPNIARLLDGGMTEDGRPYFALEYVAGEPITDFCDRHRLPVDERLRLFQRVCRAVQFAHRNLVVHRDLKPSNILVTGDGVVKLLDFGIAKLLDPDAAGMTVAQTRADVRVMTPEYAAPEQVRGEAITTATDVYALGVLLYELLTGHRPYQIPSRVRAEIERVICEEEPTRPSTVIAAVTQIHRDDGTTETITPDRVGAARKLPPTRLRRRLRGDLDTIILTALRKEPERRYTSAEQLADDLRRHLEGRPITARADTLGYRVRTFVRRHRWGVAAAAVLVLLLAGYAATLTVQSRRLAAERDAKAEALAQSEAVTQYLKSLFLAATPRVARGDTLTAYDLLDRGVERVERLRDNPALQIRLLQTFGNVFFQLGDVARAEPPLLRALALLDSLPTPPTSDQVAYLLHPLGLIRSSQGRLAEADSLLRHALALRPRLPGDTTAAMLLKTLSDNAARQDRLDEAERYIREALALRGPVAGPDDELMLTYLNSLGTYQFRQGRVDSARLTFETILERQRRTLGPDSPRTLATMGNLAVILKTLGDLDAAEALYEEVIAQERRVFPEHHPDRAPALYNLAKLRISKGDPEGALPLFDEAIAIYTHAFSPDHWRIRFFEVAKAEPLLLLERYDEAEALLLRSHADLVAALGPDAEAVRQARQNLVRLYEARHRPDLAEPYR
ncbi:serine/threonine protein kinase [Rhodothermaceae bacterium RA]|nr:serine/threonine protein kinase [Rhodothermaceae bacterium RA]